MGILARNSITVTKERDISAVYRFYLLQASTASPPSKPTVNAVPPTGWSTTEPTYTENSTNSLYFTDLTQFTDGTFSYSDVSLSSSYEAAKAAYNKAVAATTAANGKNTVHYQAAQPSTSGNKVNDIWFDTDDGNKMYYWNGSAWTAQQFGQNAISAGSITTNHLVAGAVTAAKITTDNIVGTNGWINLHNGTFNYGDKLVWNGTTLNVYGTLHSTSGDIGGFTIGSDTISTVGLSIHKGIPAETYYEEVDPVTGEITGYVDVNYDQHPGYIVMEGYSDAYSSIHSTTYRFTYNGFGVSAEVNNVTTLNISRKSISLFGRSQTQQQTVGLFETKSYADNAWSRTDYGKLSLYSFYSDEQADPAPSDDPVQSIILNSFDGSISSSGNITTSGNINASGSIAGASLDSLGDLDFHINNGHIPVIAYTGSSGTRYQMIRFLNNTVDGYGEGIAIGGGGSTIIGGGESAATVVADTTNYPTAGGQERMIIANDGAIDFLTNVQNGTASAKHFIMNSDGNFLVPNVMFIGLEKISSGSASQGQGLWLGSNGNIALTGGSNNTGAGLYFTYNGASNYTSILKEKVSGTLEIQGHFHCSKSIVSTGPGQHYCAATDTTYGVSCWVVCSGSNGDHGLYSTGYYNGSSFVSSGQYGIYRESGTGLWRVRTYSTSAATPIGSVSADKERAAYIGCNNSTTAKLYAQWYVSGNTYKYMFWTVNTSDPRLKENVKPSTLNAVDLLNKLKIYEFDWKTDKRHWNAGFLATEVYEIEPELCIKPDDEEEGYWGMNDHYFSALHTKAIQELSAENEKLKNKIERLESSLSQLMSMLTDRGVI